MNCTFTLSCKKACVYFTCIWEIVLHNAITIIYYGRDKREKRALNAIIYDRY